MDEILEEAKILSDSGIEEIIVIAQDTTKYGVDLYGEGKLPELLEELQNAGYYLAIASNKPQILLEPIVKQLFPNIRF